MAKKPAKKVACAHCKRRFVPAKRGRRPKYCSHVCRQLAYQDRRIRTAAYEMIPARLLNSDIDQIRSRDGIQRAVVDILRELGFLPPSPNPRRPTLKLVKDDKSPEKR